MADHPTPAPEGAATPAPTGRERRRNHALRDLVDEMLASIRVVANQDLWSDDERARYEEDLARIMERVRGEAIRKP
ncbi:MAG TPA: hypothetical protein VEZ47_11760 [Gemmatirosa sp.]|nr:hypothetical protein [Gemmatirosa sp.]